MLSEMRIVEREFARRPASADEDGRPITQPRAPRRGLVALLREMAWVIDTPYAAALLRPALKDVQSSRTRSASPQAAPGAPAARRTSRFHSAITA